jgi:hypothetical protein
MTMLGAVVLTAFASAALFAQSVTTKEIVLDGSRQWVDTGLDIAPGDTISLESSGSLRYSSVRGQSIGPEGIRRSWTDLLRTFPLNDAGRGAVIGRIGDRVGVRPFLVGPRRESRAPVAGRLFIGVNQPDGDSGTGEYKVTVKLTKAVQNASSDGVLTGKLSQQQLDTVAPRVVDAEGTEGDRVNFFIVGSEDQMKTALTNAGWIVVDRSVKDTILRGALATFSRQAYVTLPMSELLMFGRGQDYGWAQGDPVQVVAARHHFRVWKAPFTVGGQTVWAGAGTHDVGFDRDQRNGKITHSIDPDTDKERDYIGKSLQETGQVVALEYMTPKRTVREAKTAHGQPFFSDGRTLIIYLRPDVRNMAQAFGDLFCTVLKKENPDGGDWGGCDTYFQGGGKTDLALPEIRKDVRYLIVPGFMSSCFADSPAFQEGFEHVRTKYGATVDLLQVPNDPSEDNAKLIADYIRQQMAGNDKRKFVVIGYSKGAPDIHEALHRENIAGSVAAFISVAGAVGGSAIADTIPGMVDKYIQMYKMQGCKGDLAKGFKSLRREVRQAFLSSFPHLPVPSYSIVAISDEKNTSKALLQSWQLLKVFENALDGQLTKSDAVLPEGQYLGAAVADHFGIALPFDKAANEQMRSFMGSKYPRAALFEAMLRYVSADLSKQPATPAPSNTKEPATISPFSPQ